MDFLQNPEFWYVAGPVAGLIVARVIPGPWQGLVIKVFNAIGDSKKKKGT